MKMKTFHGKGNKRYTFLKRYILIFYKDVFRDIYVLQNVRHVLLDLFSEDY